MSPESFSRSVKSLPNAIKSSGDSTFGNMRPTIFLDPKAAMSPFAKGVFKALMRTYMRFPGYLSKRSLTVFRVDSFSAKGTASSKSIMTASASKPRAFSTLSGRLPGAKRAVLIGFIHTSFSLNDSSVNRVRIISYCFIASLRISMISLKCSGTWAPAFFSIVILLVGLPVSPSIMEAACPNTVPSGKSSTNLPAT